MKVNHLLEKQKSMTLFSKIHGSNISERELDKIKLFRKTLPLEAKMWAMEEECC